MVQIYVASAFSKDNKGGNKAGVVFDRPDLTDVTAICRNFAPLYGIDEESATGTSNCALASYLFKYYKKCSRYVFEQGYNLGEVSRIVIKLQYEKETIKSVFVGGYGHLVKTVNM